MIYTLEVVTPPSTDLDMVEDLKKHLRLNTDDEDDQLQGYVNAAIQQFEFSTNNRILRTTTYRQRQDYLCFPIEIKAGPVSSVTSVKYYDSDDAEQTITGFNSDLTGIPALVWLPSTHDLYGSSFSLSCARPRPVTIEFVAGGSSIPSDVNLALKLLAAHYYAQREAYIVENLKDLPMGFRAICNKYQTGIKTW